MATVVNTRDVLLLGSATRILWTGVRGIKIAADAATFSVTNAGVPTPATVNFTSTLNGISGTINWSVVLGTATLTSSTGATTSLVYASMTSKVITVRATIVDGGVTYTDEFTISKVVDGSTGGAGAAGVDAKLMSISSSGQVFQINKSNVASPSSITFKAIRNNITGATYSVISGTATLTSLSGDDATLLFSNMSSDTVTIKVIDSTNTFSDTVTIVKVREGIDSISGYLSNESVTVPADSSGVVTTYSGASGNFIVYYGAVDVTSSCTFAVQSNPDVLTPTNSIVTSGASAGTYAITGGLSGLDESSITYRATYTNAFGNVFTIDKVFSLTKSKTGTTGATGTTGSAARIAYVKTTGTLSPTPSLSTVSGDVLPTTGTWGESNAWQNYPPSIVAGEQVWQTTGTYNYLTNQTTWVAPYLSNLKVGTLSALTVNTGTLTVDASGYVRGGQTGYNTGTGFWLGYDSGAYKFSIGSSSQNLKWDGSALIMTGSLQVNTAAISGTTMTGSGAQFNAAGTFALGSSSNNMTYNGSILKLNMYGGGITFGNAFGDNLTNFSRTTSTLLPAVFITDSSNASSEMLYVSNSASFTGSRLASLIAASGDALLLQAPAAKNALHLFSGRLGFGSSVPIDLNGSMGSAGQTLISQGSGNTPSWGKSIDGGSATSDGSGNATIAVVMPNANFGFSACPTSGKIVTVTSVTNTGGNNYNVVVQTQTSSTGAAAASVPFRWTAIG